MSRPIRLIHFRLWRFVATMLALAVMATIVFSLTYRRGYSCGADAALATVAATYHALEPYMRAETEQRQREIGLAWAKALRQTGRVDYQDAAAFIELTIMLWDVPEQGTMPE